MSLQHNQGCNYLNKQKKNDNQMVVESLQRLRIRNLWYQGSTAQYKFSLTDTALHSH